MKLAFILTILFSGVTLSACNPFNRDNATPTATPSASITPDSTILPSSEGTPTTTIPVQQSEVSLKLPAVGATIDSPFEIEGTAPGPWFFEGQVLGELRSATNEQLAVFPLQADGEWMTEGPVKFVGSASFSKTKAGTTITLIISNDNPSGLSENDKRATFQFQVAQ